MAASMLCMMGAAILYGHVTWIQPVTVEKFRDKVSVGPAVPARQKQI